MNAIKLTTTIALTAIGLVQGLQAQQADESLDPAVAELSKFYDSGLEVATEALSKMEARYLEELEKLKKEVSAAGDLDAALLIEDELKTFGSAKSRDFRSIPKLKRLRELYETGVRQIGPDVAKKRLALMTAYLTKFNQLKQKLTQDGNLEAAKQADAKARELAALIAEGAKMDQMATLAPIWRMTRIRDVESIRNCQIEEESGKFILTSESGSSYVNSDEEFELPVRIAARAATDSTNIRFYFGDVNVTIFNWEKDPNQLRIHNPVTNRPHGFVGTGALTKNQFYDLTIDIRKDSLIVSVNGEERAQLEGDFEKAEGPAGIGPAFKSAVTVESFEVYKLPSLDE